jgi:hypothetical protein
VLLVIFFSFRSPRERYRTYMLARIAKNRRFLEITQLVMTFASVCLVVDASRIHRPDGTPGYQASIPWKREAAQDRRIGDLARVERKRREAAHDESRRGLTTGRFLELRAGATPSTAA